MVTALKLLLAFPSYISTDFDVHRNWLSITHSLPISQWYYEETNQWTLDYPPFFAYFEWILAQIAERLNLDPNMLSITPDAVRSPDTIAFQRMSVIITDLLFVFACHLCVTRLYKNENIAKFITFTLLLLTPGLIIVDHIHFQYNGMLFGILLLSLLTIRCDYNLIGAILFAILLNFKHIFLCLAPVYFVYLLQKYCMVFTIHPKTEIRRTYFSLPRFLLLSFCVLAVFGLSFGPFIYLGQFGQVLKRLFPFQRGLTHAYWAPNFWALYNTADLVLVKVLKVAGFDYQPAALTGGIIGEVQHSVLPTIYPIYTIILTLVFLMPMLYNVYRYPSVPSFKTSIVLSALTFFLFGWHVHEKAILIALIPMYLLVGRSATYARMAFILSIAGNYSLFPLLYQAQETPVKVLLLLLHTLLFYYLVEHMYKFTADEQGVQSFTFYKMEVLYFFGFVPLQIFTSVVQPLLLPSHTFLPLLLTSCYCSVGIIYSYVLLYIKTYKEHA